MASSPTYLGPSKTFKVHRQRCPDQNTILAWRSSTVTAIDRQIGSFVRISIGFNDLLWHRLAGGAGAVPEALAKLEPYGNRWLRVQLIGEAQRSGGFHRGVSQHSTIGDEASRQRAGLARIYGREDAKNYVRIGGLAYTESIPALIDIDRLIQGTAQSLARRDLENQRPSPI